MLEIPGIETSLIDKDNTSYIFIGYGTKWPFQSGQCDMAINSQGIMEIVLSRLMYNGHTMSVNVFVNTSNLEYLSKRSTLDSNNIYYHVSKNYNVSHSFEERVIALSDDEFLNDVATTVSEEDAGSSTGKTYEIESSGEEGEEQGVILWE